MRKTLRLILLGSMLCFGCNSEKEKITESQIQEIPRQEIQEPLKVQNGTYEIRFTKNGREYKMEYPGRNYDIEVTPVN